MGELFQGKGSFLLWSGDPEGISGTYFLVWEWILIG